MHAMSHGSGLAERAFLSVALAAAALVTAPGARADGLFVAPCGAEAFVGLASSVIHCSVGSLADNAIGGATATAGLNQFENHISPVHFYGDSDAFDDSATWSVSSSPTWAAGVTKVQTYLRLDGAVKLQGPGSSIKITLTGLLGGAPIEIERSFTWGGAPVEILLSEEAWGEQAVADAALETLKIDIVGRARYDVDGSPTFIGAVPEPASWALMALGGLALLGARRRQARRGA